MINIQVLKVMFNKMDSCIKMNRGGVNLFYRMRYGMGIVWNYLRYKATISDYFELRFFEKNSKEKKEYLTSKDGLRFAQYVDSQEVFTQLCSKKEMYRELKKYVKRDQLYSAESKKEDFEKFVDNANIYPMVAFIVVAVLGFITGSNWGIPAVCAPIIIPLGAACGANLLIVIAAIVCGGTFCSHACFYSDATVITSSSCGIENMEHVYSQLPYTMIAAGIASILFLIAGFIF